MSKHIKLFNNHTQYRSFIENNPILPNVSSCTVENDIHYNPTTYYLYNTTDASIEKKIISDKDTLSFPLLLGNTYGGVYTNYGGKGSIVDSPTFELQFVNTDTITDTEGTPYIGEETETTDALFKWSDVITNNTLVYTPEKSKVYYLKENPQWILLRYTHYLYNKNDSSRPLTNLWFITAIDSFNYNSVKMMFKETEQEEFEEINMHAAKTLTISGTTLKAGNVFKSKGCPTNVGYICYTDDFLSNLEVGKTYILYFTAETPDGIIIHSPVKYQLTINSLTITGLSVEEIDF